MANVKTCDDCSQSVKDACLTHLKRVKPEHVACVYHIRKKESGTSRMMQTDSAAPRLADNYRPL
ncbi:hypothetical protein GALL_71090 [mine drainage metagenome]|uniref:Uncharacterized protein n=1 Tax=mine drainage metagenome TaxID=410659 RepID=A0A1J5T3W3_9ZZZZ